MAKLYVEQAPAQTLLGAGRTYAPAEPTYSAVSQFAPDYRVGRENPASSSQVETAGRLKLLLSRIIDCCKHSARKSRFPLHICDQPRPSRRIQVLRHE